VRRPTTVFAGLSLLLCVVTLAVWARSFLPADLHVGASHGRLILLFSDPRLTRSWQRQGGGQSGLAAISAAEQWQKVRAGKFIEPEILVMRAGATAPTSGNVPPRIMSFAGIAFANESTTGPTQYRLIAVPLLYPAALLAIPPILWLAASVRRRRRATAGRCAGCGYDLRASTGRCPECGADAAAASPA
jgi:hypothetical protein